MLTESEMRELLSYAGHGPVLSVYLNTDPAEGNADAYRLRLRTMLKQIEPRADAEEILSYFDHSYDWAGRSVALYSSVEDGFFRAYPLHVPVRERVRYAPLPHVKPLADLIDNYGGYAVALVDKQGARLFYFHMGQLIEQEGVLGEEVRRTKRGGASSFPGRRGGIAGRTEYVAEAVDRNMKEAADFAAHFFSEHRVRRIILGGTDENTNLFRSQLPKTWQSLIVGTLPLAMTAGKEEVFERAMHIIREEDHRRETEQIEKAITLAAKGSTGATGLDHVLEAVKQGRVMTLLVSDGYRSAGYQCEQCGYLTTQYAEACSYCGGKFDEIGDVVDMAVNEVMKAGGDVEIVHNLPELEKVGRIGALLRY